MYASTGNVFLDLGFSRAQAAQLLVRTELMRSIQRAIQELELTQTAAAKLLGVSQPRISNLVRERTELFSTDALIAMLGRLGYRVQLSIARNQRVRRLR